MKVTVIYSPGPRQTREWQLDVPDASTAAFVIEKSGALNAFAELATAPLQLGIWGRKCAANQVLVEQDRLEIYRPLRVDPKIARRERFRGQGVKRAGLFAKVREGGKAGY